MTDHGTDFDRPEEAKLRAVLNEVVPELSAAPLSEVASTGTDNHLFRLGDRYVIRLPKRPDAVEPLTRETAILPLLAGLPLMTPTILASGAYDAVRPFLVLEWIEGAPATDLTGQQEAARALAVFLAQLQQLPTNTSYAAGPANQFRGAPISCLNDRVAAAIPVLADEIDADAAQSIWATALAAPAPKNAVWVHGDLKSDNLIATDDRLTGVIDWGLAAVGDPAVDVAAAWTWVLPEHRDDFLETLAANDATRKRAAGWALYMAVVALAYYRDRDADALCAQSRRTLQALGLKRI